MVVDVVKYSCSASKQSMQLTEVVVAEEEAGEADTVGEEEREEEGGMKQHALQVE